MVLLIPYSMILDLSPHFASHTSWPLWTAPVGVGCVLLVLDVWRPLRRVDPKTVDHVRSRDERRAVYRHARDMLPRDAAFRPGPNLILACLATSLLFVFVLPLLLPGNYVTVAFNFLCMVYGFQLSLHLYCIAISQNFAMRVEPNPLVKLETEKVG